MELERAAATLGLCDSHSQAGKVQLNRAQHQSPGESWQGLPIRTKAEARWAASRGAVVFSPPLPPSLPWRPADPWSPQGWSDPGGAPRGRAHPPMQTPARRPRLPGPADPRRPAGPTPRPRRAPSRPRPPTPRRRRPRSRPRTSGRARAGREREAGRPTRCGGAVSGAAPPRSWRSTSRPFATRTAIWSAATR